MASTSTHNDKDPKNSSAADIEPPPEDDYLSNCSHLSRQEVLRRRSNHMKQLAKSYRQYYWGLMEEIRARYRDYTRKFGRISIQEDHKEEEKDNVNEKQVGDGIDEGNVQAGNGNGSSSRMRCAFQGCFVNAMILTRFCSLHILSDPKQQLYKPCEYVIKRALNGDVKCGKPVLRSMVPSLCRDHLQKAQQHVICALKKAGLNISSTNMIAPKFHVVVAEYVREIKERRKIASIPKLAIGN